MNSKADGRSGDCQKREPRYRHMGRRPRWHAKTCTNKAATCHRPLREPQSLQNPPSTAACQSWHTTWQTPFGPPCSYPRIGVRHAPDTGWKHPSPTDNSSVPCRRQCRLRSMPCRPPDGSTRPSPPHGRPVSTTDRQHGSPPPQPQSWAKRTPPPRCRATHKTSPKDGSCSARLCPPYSWLGYTEQSPDRDRESGSRSTGCSWHRTSSRTWHPCPDLSRW